MKYNFDEAVNRRNTGSLKWDVKENELPMWVADMDFKTAPQIQQAIIKRAESGVFGYSIVPDEWSESIIEWWSSYHSWKIEKDWLIFSAGVVPTISSVVRKLTTPAEKVVFMTPVYNIFYNSVLNNGRNVLESPLEYDGNEYKINFEDLEEKLSDPQTSLLILCNPHNPTGNIWSREELAKIGDMCVKYGVTVLSDEIHCDITEPDADYIPFASVSENCRNNSIICISPTKCFNIAGIQTSAVAVANPIIRHKVWRGLNTDEVAEPNVFAVTASVTAFSEGREWLEELREYISENRRLVNEYLESEIPQIKAVKSKATYLMWLDCSELKIHSEKLAEYIRKNSGLYVSEGSQFGGNGKSFLRFNIACPKATVKDGLERLKQSIDSLCREP
ncbi:MAG: pyridoxal phosphate-dependent aminotransferase [Ruminococcus sp.]|nr:pyridoxal phosphate-dependent aminotransferase [Ruminococcus sp.]